MKEGIAPPMRAFAECNLRSTICNDAVLYQKPVVINMSFGVYGFISKRMR
jgi:hypothetical protein